MPRPETLPFEIDNLDARTIGTNFRTIQANFVLLDSRRIAQIGAVTEGADDAATIHNLVAKINELTAALNASDLTED